MKYKLLLFLFFVNVELSLRRDKMCYHKYKRTKGICKSRTDCPSIYDDVAKGIRLQGCRYSSTVVCCVQTRRVGQKIREMCQSCKDLVYRNNGFSKTNICPWQTKGLSSIYGGKRAFMGEFPHMALIGYGGKQKAWLCGGSLISEKHVLTAGHCLYAQTYGKPKIVRLGDLNYTDNTDNQHAQNIRIKKLHKHPDYEYPATYHDIAILELKYSAKLSIYVKPVCIYPNRDLPVNEVIATGWGYTENDIKSDYLLKTTLDIARIDDCAKIYGKSKWFPRGLLDHNQICAGSYQYKRDTCPGDSGGPIQIYNKDFSCSYYILGITSHGKKCGLRNVAGVYVRIYPYIEWIENVVWK